MKITHRIPTDQYAYIEFTEEHSSIEDAMAIHEYWNRHYKDVGEGLDKRVWVRTRNEMLVKGECDPELIHQMSKAQRWFINELKIALRSTKAEEPVIE